MTLGELELGGVYGALRGAVGADIESPPAADALAERLDPAAFRPRLAPWVEIKPFRLRWGNDYVMVANHRDHVHLRFDADVAAILPLMDGTRTVKEIVVERLGATGDLDLEGVIELTQALYGGNFLEQRFVDVEDALARRLRPQRRVARAIRSLRVEWQDPDRPVEWLYRHGGRLALSRPGAAAGVVVALAGVVAFCSLVLDRRFDLSAGSLAYGFLLLLLLNLGGVFFHELGHAIVLTHYGRRAKAAGIMLYFGSPAFYVESSEAFMLERGQRIRQSFAGPFAEAVVAGMVAVVVWFLPAGPVTALLFKFLVMTYLGVAMNLVPFLELDGYFIFADLIHVPDLRSRSLAFLRHDLWHDLRARERLSRTELGLLLYGVLGTAFTVFSLYTAVFFWKLVFGPLVSRLWHESVPTRMALLVLAVVVLQPLLQGGVDATRSVARRIRAAWRRLRFHLQRGWRVEAATLVDSLPLFDDVPEGVLGELAGRVRLRSLSSGRSVFRQGDRPDAFYVVRRGRLRVLEEHEDGNEKVVRTLGPGDSFGELALLDGSPRTATVRAAVDSEIFEFDKGAFDELLADMVNVPEYRRTLQQAAELRRLPCFAHLGTEQLAELLQQGAWANVSPGTAIVVEGEPGDAFFAIGAGRSRVLRRGEEIRRLGAGDYFGEVALLLDTPRTATVEAITPTRVFRMDRGGFDRVLASVFRSGTLRVQAGEVRTS